ncbi:hypothetical protein OKA04_23395 [Luteolibacter flavescens]|uniref:Uncharacterized protein n=1 Tax=Luteolibacter flavescens TaxID=1859460 RepID=A0ABT3FVW9_9BACT|nr:hypothetical protein [Luteolibacter flavescens]MCW1887702.1 hypothetical protein [Luteolibacter flavescens]
MPTRETSRTFNLNTVVGLCTLIGGFVAAAFYFAPLQTLPDDMREVKKEVGTMQNVQAVQTDALQRLAKVAEDGANTRREVDRAATEIREVKRRLERLEQR